MTILEIRERVALIASLAQRDPEAAHGERDTLMVDALRHIAVGEYDDVGDPECPPTSILALEVLKTLEIKLRWEACA